MRLMPERQCVGCRNQVRWGCEAEPTGEVDELGQPVWLRPAELPLTIDDEETFACPRQDYHRRPGAWNAMLKFYGMYKQGFLPQAGAVQDQANRAVEVFRVFDDVSATCDKEEAESRTRGSRDPFADRR